MRESLGSLIFQFASVDESEKYFFEKMSNISKEISNA